MDFSLYVDAIWMNMKVANYKVVDLQWWNDHFKYILQISIPRIDPERAGQATQTHSK